MHVLACVRINVCACSMPSLKCGNMLSLGIRRSGSDSETLLKYLYLRNSQTKLLYVKLQYNTMCNSITGTSITLFHHSRIPTVLDGKAPEPPLISHDTVAGLSCLFRKPQMSRKPLDISANHSSLNKHFLNDLREKETRDRQTMQPNKAPRPLTNLNPN